MRICVILEGCYPYVHGGVSSWIHDYINAMPEYEFILWVIADSREKKGKFVYDLPSNVVEVREEFLADALYSKEISNKKIGFSLPEIDAIKKMMLCQNPEWDILFRIFQKRKVDFVSFLKSQVFLDIIEEICETLYPGASFSELFHSIRSMILPIIYMLTKTIPKADIYHSICTGYGGLLGALGSWFYKRPYILTEHGIYTREREEEIIRAKWVSPYLKDHWIRLYDMLAKLAYEKTDRVTSLFHRAKEAQISIGCEDIKCRVIENGVRCERFEHISVKPDNGNVDIGAIVRIARIKDIKTLLYAFHELNRKNPHTNLHIIGPVDDEEYKDECMALISDLKIRNVIFTGMVKIDNYMKKLDFIVLSSISEGQPLSIIESFAANRPCIATDVGCCKELLMGDKDDSFGIAGICVPPLNKSELAKAMEYLCVHKEDRLKMGEVGRQRALKYFRHADMLNHYNKIYKEVIKTWQELDSN